MKSFIKCALIFMTVILSQQMVFAQTDFQNIRKLKIEMVLRDMNLSPETEQKFLPVYNAFCDETLALKRKIKGLDKSNADAQSKLAYRQQYKEQLLQVEKKYNERFLKIITPQQLEIMHKSEDTFRKALIDKRNGK